MLIPRKLFWCSMVILGLLAAIGPPGPALTPEQIW